MKILEVNQKLITKGPQLEEIREIGKKIQISVSTF